MQTDKLKEKLCSSWKRPEALEKANGSIIAYDSEQNNELHFNTYLINSNVFCKLWQYHFGNLLYKGYYPTTIQYWKYLSDCNFNSKDWKSNNVYPKENQEVICWINLSKTSYDFTKDPSAIGYQIPLKYLGSRIHIGFFRKKLFRKYLISKTDKFDKIPWNSVFKWITIDEFFKINEDPRNFEIDPFTQTNYDWLIKKKS